MRRWLRFGVRVILAVLYMTHNVVNDVEKYKFGSSHCKASNISSIAQQRSPKFIEHRLAPPKEQQRKGFYNLTGTGKLLRPSYTYSQSVSVRTADPIYQIYFCRLLESPAPQMIDYVSHREVLNTRAPRRTRTSAQNIMGERSWVKGQLPEGNGRGNSVQVGAPTWTESACRSETRVIRLMTILQARRLMDMSNVLAPQRHMQNLFTR